MVYTDVIERFISAFRLDSSEEKKREEENLLAVSHLANRTTACLAILVLGMEERDEWERGYYSG